jgi:hypothetical protein
VDEVAESIQLLKSNFALSSVGAVGIPKKLITTLIAEPQFSMAA